MSVIVGLYDPATKKSLLCTDSICTSGDFIQPPSTKAFIVMGLAFGLTGHTAMSFAAERWLREKMKKRPRDRRSVEDLLAKMHAYLLAKAHTPATAYSPESTYTTCIVATPWGIVHLCHSGGVEWADEHVIGAGREVAAGALYALNHTTSYLHGEPLTLEEKAIIAIEAACARLTTCGLPTQVFWSESSRP